jgi:transposase InsO family protein
MAVKSLKGYVDYLLIVDLATRFVIIKPMLDLTMHTVAIILFELFCLVGFPKILQSDNGTENVNQIVAEIVKLSKIDHRLITAYNPRANSVAERFIGSSSNIIYKMLDGRLNDWDS